MKGFTVELAGELLELLGSEEEARRDAKIAVVLDLVRRGRISRAKAAELLGLALWDLPTLLAQYRIPWFDSSPDDVERDLEPCDDPWLGGIVGGDQAAESLATRSFFRWRSACQRSYCT